MSDFAKMFLFHNLIAHSVNKMFAEIFDLMKKSDITEKEMAVYLESMEQLLTMLEIADYKSEDKREVVDSLRKLDDSCQGTNKYHEPALRFLESCIYRLNKRLSALQSDQQLEALESEEPVLSVEKEEYHNPEY